MTYRQAKITIAILAIECAAALILNIAQLKWMMDARERSSALIERSIANTDRCHDFVREQHEQIAACADHLRRASAVVGAAKTVAGIPYDKKASNCLDHSLLLVSRLAESSIDSYIAITQDRRHAFVLVGMEPTPGNPNAGGFARPGAYGPITEIRDRNLKVICTKP